MPAIPPLSRVKLPMTVVRFARVITLLALMALPGLAGAMGIRSFVALPVDRGGWVSRFQYLNNFDTDVSTFITNVAWGLSGKDTLLFALPYRLSPSGPNRLGDFSAIYRHTLWQQDTKNSTRRLALLAGGVLATDSQRDGALQLGLVTTVFQARHGFDFDLLYRKGLGSRADDGRYDISWQYRLSPVEYPEWGFATEWYSVIELNGRWRRGHAMDHQITVGAQWVHHNWVLEGGLVQTINNNKETQVLISTRFHF